MATLSQKQIFKLPSCKRNDWRNALPKKYSDLEEKKIEVDCNDWSFSCRDLKQLINLLENIGIKLDKIYAKRTETVVSASSLGISAQLILPRPDLQESNQSHKDSSAENSEGILFHKGTLRSGEQIEHEGHILVLGDVNPGAQVSATGDVMICGRLMGTAHAGKGGKTSAKIVALQLRPLQLRIANQIARGPEEKPKDGLAEEALIQKGTIVIQPANSNGFCK